MARLYISEFAATALVKGRNTELLDLSKKTADQSVAIAGTSAQSGVLAANTAILRLETDADCHVEIGANPTAVQTAGSEVGVTILSGNTATFAVQPGQSYKLAVIAQL